MEVTKAVFARMCGVSKTAISKKAQSGTLVVNSGGRIETEHPVNRDYMLQKQIKMQEKVKNENEMSKLGKKDFEQTAFPAAVPNQSANVSVEGISEKMLSMTIRDLVATYGGTNGVEKYAKILQILTASNEKDLRIQERRLTLVPKDFVTSRLFGYLDQLMNKLLDWPESAADTLIAKVLAKKEESRSEIVTYIRDGLTRCICDAKDHVIYEINSLRGKYDNTENDIEDLKDQVSEIKNEQTAEEWR